MPTTPQPPGSPHPRHPGAGPSAVPPAPGWPGPDGDGDGPSAAELGRRLVAFAEARHWQPFHTPKNLVAALSVEASELVEIFQWSTPEESARVMDDPGQAHRVRDEVADVLAYLLQFCAAVGVDPLTALAAKIERNEQRFPAPTPGRSDGTDRPAPVDEPEHTPPY
ncbi:nucleotide pyrophosphohydrolase [Streptomyces uncialis]|uniref:nucleotide pyrophosphohydrolase n=1 Tax=Streptomyces uncialis TaxID=1048205 RepID=UPI0037980167